MIDNIDVFNKIRIEKAREKLASAGSGGDSDGLQMPPPKQSASVMPKDHPATKLWDAFTRNNHRTVPGGGYLLKFQLSDYASKLMKHSHIRHQSTFHHAGVMIADEIMALRGLWFEAFVQVCRKLQIECPMDTLIDLFQTQSTAGFMTLEDLNNLPKLVFLKMGVWWGLLQTFLQREGITIPSSIIKSWFGVIDRDEKRRNKEAHVDGLVPFHTACKRVVKNVQSQGLWFEAVQFILEEVGLNMGKGQFADTFTALSGEAGTPGFIQYRQLFDIFDICLSPKGLTFDKICDLWRTMGTNLPNEMLLSMFNMIDINEDQQLDIEEFTEGTMLLYRDQMPKYFLRLARLAPEQIVPWILMVLGGLIVFDLFVYAAAMSFWLPSSWPAIVICTVYVSTGYMAASRAAGIDYKGTLISYMSRALGVNEKKLRSICLGQE
jgi:hypothetical protein